MSRKKITSKNASMEAGSGGVSREERHQLIATAAYYRAEDRGFAPGAELQDWLEAEVEFESKAMKTTAASIE